MQSIAATLARCAFVAGSLAAALCAAQTVTPPGADKSAKTRALEAGAKILQGSGPVPGFDIYLVGFHPMRDMPGNQIEAHHYCHQQNEDFAQCMLFDGNSRNANLHGVEYIISEKLFATLPAAERRYWHPHNGEILSGQLVAPGLPAAAEKSLMRSKMNSYGKTWHLWNTGHHGQPNDALPFGEPMLAWSFNRDGEAAPGLVEQRDRRLDLDPARLRSQRADLRALARPQAGVDAMQGQFGRPTSEIPGVVDSGSAARR
ncbi:outer membrane or secreted lipoprotein [Duganella sp. Leaf126]|uniref:OBAP family protein n=1 Tax=Duganella sp. Leaf126 TaxID=1736266 RepID=UPI0006FFB288|nr:OBAP family protein [Duganella sp. Leaf126]KQQ32360.1 outer membrane or secreted lipoprotein [Duganella sp. Leaf126]